MPIPYATSLSLHSCILQPAVAEQSVLPRPSIPRAKAISLDSLYLSLYLLLSSSVLFHFVTQLHCLFLLCLSHSPPSLSILRFELSNSALPCNFCCIRCIIHSFIQVYHRVKAAASWRRRTVPLQERSRISR